MKPRFRSNSPKNKTVFTLFPHKSKTSSKFSHLSVFIFWSFRLNISDLVCSACSGEKTSQEVTKPRGRAMGCGGSRTDALEPRYLESWTKETESTWLTSTDTDIPLSSIQSIPSENSEAGFASEKTISPGRRNDLWLAAWLNEYLIRLLT